MTRRLTTIAKPTLFLVATAAVLAGCGAGQTPLTSKVKTAAQGLNLQQGSVKILNAAVVLDGPAVAGAKSATATVRVVLINTGNLEDTLLGVSSSSASKVEILDDSKAVTTQPLVTEQSVAFGNGTYSLKLTDVAPAPLPGTYLPVTFTFKLAGELSTQLPVLAAADATE